MYNKDYSYKDIVLWDEKEWNDRFCPLFPLYYRISCLNDEKHRQAVGSGPYANRTDGEYSAKTRAVIYEDVAESIRSIGMEARVYSMGEVNWVPVVPQKGIKRPEGEIPVLVVQQSVDYEDRNWAMDTLWLHRRYIELAASEDFALVFVCTSYPDRDNLFPSVIMEFGALYRSDLEELYLDISTLVSEGATLKDTPGFKYRNTVGGAESDPDKHIHMLGDIPAIGITDMWQNHVSNLWGTACAVRSASNEFNLQKHIHSICGKKMAEYMHLEHDYDNADDPRLTEHWKSMGIMYENHITDGQKWVSMVPLCAANAGDERIPVMMIFREVYRNNGYLPLIAISGFYDYTELCAQGDLILLIFAMEDPDDNDLFLDILHEAAEIYPIDKDRVYVTGHSHNGMYAFEFARRHWREVAAAALQGQRLGLMAPSYSGAPIAVPDSSIEQLAGIDLPVIAIAGQAENIMTRFPVGSRNHMNAVDAYRRRLKAFHCPEKTEEEIIASRNSPDYATRRLGIPADSTEVQVVYGRECYIGHVLNNEGKEYFRACVIDNLPHITTPMTPFLSWNFVRRFARNRETGEIRELY